jgi:hypothetical protein
MRILRDIAAMLAARMIQTAFAQAGRECKNIPGSEGWPSMDMWSKLNSSIDGRLLRPLPPGAVCHQGQPVYNQSLCQAVQLSWQDEYFHADDPVSVEWNNWNNDTCLPIPGFPCSSIGYPVYVINATLSQHVREGIKFGMLLNATLSAL